MKINAHIIAVEDQGDAINIVAQGTAKKKTVMERMSLISLVVPMTLTNRKTFHLGREISITIKAKQDR